MNWYGLPFFLAVTLINKGKGELLLISSTPLNDTVQITETQGGGTKTEKRRADERKSGLCEAAVFPWRWSPSGHWVSGTLGCPCENVSQKSFSPYLQGQAMIFHQGYRHGKPKGWLSLRHG